MENVADPLPYIFVLAHQTLSSDGALLHKYTLNSVTGSGTRSGLCGLQTGSSTGLWADFCEFIALIRTKTPMKWHISPPMHSQSVDPILLSTESVSLIDFTHTLLHN